MTIPDAKWWKFGRYEIQDRIKFESQPRFRQQETEDGTKTTVRVETGTEIRTPYITPVPRDGWSQKPELFSFNPWQKLNREKDEADRVPYLELVDLVREVPAGINLSDESYKSSKPYESYKKSVCEWCGRYGLLGLLPHNVRSVRIESWKVDRVGSRFEQSHYSYQSDDGEYGWADPPPEEIIVEDFGCGTESADVNVEWWPYFPGLVALEPRVLRKSENLPPVTLEDYAILEDPRTPVDSKILRELVPLEKSFWNHYRESLLDFTAYARYFVNAIDVIAGTSQEKFVYEGGELSGSILDRNGAVERLNQLASVVTQQVRIAENGNFIHSWQSPSLLGHLAMNAIQDMLLESVVRVCDCGKTFSTSDSKRKYCREDHQIKYRQRKYRERRKHAAQKRKR